MKVEIVQAPKQARDSYAAGFMEFRLCRPPPKIFPDGEPTEADRKFSLELWRSLDIASRSWYAVNGVQSLHCDFFLVPITPDDLARLDLPERILEFYGHVHLGISMTNVFLEPCTDVFFRRWPHSGSRHWRAPRPIFINGTPTESDRALALKMFNRLDRTSQCWYVKSQPPGFTDLSLSPEELAAFTLELAAMPDEHLNPEYRYYRGRS